MDVEKINEVKRKHRLWLQEVEGGERADFIHANLNYANLNYSDLSNADLYYANFSNANLSNADLSSASLWGAIGNRREIKSTQIEAYSIAYTFDRLQIGCENHSIEEWRSFDDDTIAEMDCGALLFWEKWKDFIFQMIEMSPAVATGHEGK